jgi:hypothetical protein
MHIRLILLVAAGIAGLGAAVLRLTRKKPANKRCARCGAPAMHGYSKAAESAPEDIVPLCVPCLLERLDEDYCTFERHAVVIQPVAELPCYVFRPKSDWGEPLQAELDTLLAGLQDHCSSCTNPARYLWVNALDAGPVANLPQMGITQTLLAPGSAHFPVCRVLGAAHRPEFRRTRSRIRGSLRATRQRRRPGDDDRLLSEGQTKSIIWVGNRLPS